jgi:hypothetical protein
LGPAHAAALSTAQLRTLVGTDVAFAVILLGVATAGHAPIDDVNLKRAALLLAGSVSCVSRNALRHGASRANVLDRSFSGGYQQPALY